MFVQVNKTNKCSVSVSSLKLVVTLYYYYDEDDEDDEEFDVYTVMACNGNEICRNSN